MKSKGSILLGVIIVIIILLIPSGLTSLYADSLTSGSNLNLYQGWGIASDSYVKFGKFNGKDILWRVLRQDNGVNGVKLISEEILTFRQFDIAGDDLWSGSDIRTWLNNDFYNGLGTDKNYIQNTNVATMGVTTKDKVFLPGWEEMLNSPFDNDPNAGDLKRAANYDIQIIFSYWLRDVANFNPVRLYVVNSYPDGCFVNTSYLAIEFGKGIRPVLYLKQGLFFTGNGTISDPYVISETLNSESKVPVRIRTMPMTCWQVWINEDNMFEFIFDYYHADNNWVKIYDMDGNMVWETNFAYGKNRFIAELPDGMYTVKTFHNNMDEPIQEFMIGKP